MLERRPAALLWTAGFGGAGGALGGFGGDADEECAEPAVAGIVREAFVPGEVYAVVRQGEGRRQGDDAELAGERGESAGSRKNEVALRDDGQG